MTIAKRTRPPNVIAAAPAIFFQICRPRCGSMGSGPPINSLVSFGITSLLVLRFGTDEILGMIGVTEHVADGAGHGLVQQAQQTVGPVDVAGADKIAAPAVG